MMSKTVEIRLGTGAGLLLGILVSVLVSGCGSTSPRSQTQTGTPTSYSPSPDFEPTIEAFLENPVGFYYRQKASEAIQCAQTVLSDDAYTVDDRKRTLIALGAIYVSTDREPEARAAFSELLRLDPMADLDPPGAFPPPVQESFYGLRDSLLLRAESELPSDIRTVAVGPMDAVPLVAGKFDLEKFSRGLNQILVTDLMGATPLKIVERQRLGVLMQEIEMNSNEQIFDPEYAVKLARLSGAQSYLFGSVLQVDRQKIRFDLRWVDTATTEVLISEGVEMKVENADDLFKLEREVLLNLLVPKIHGILAANDPDGTPKEKELEKRMKDLLEKRKKRSGSFENASYVDVLLTTGEALMAEDRGDLAGAQRAWKRVHEMDPHHGEAEQRSLALVAHLEMSEGGGR